MTSQMRLMLADPNKKYLLETCPNCKEIVCRSGYGKKFNRIRSKCKCEIRDEKIDSIINNNNKNDKLK